MGEPDQSDNEDIIETAIGARPRIQRTLLRSHLALAMIWFVIVVFSLVAHVVLRATSRQLSQLNAPAVELALSCELGLERSLAALRGWVVLGDAAFLDERESAWKNEIRPSLEGLVRLSSHPKSSLSEVRLDELKRKLEDLYVAQWSIEDIAHSPGNEPAVQILRDNIEPLFRTTIGATTNMIDLEKLRPVGEEENRVLGIMADFRYTFTTTDANLADVVATGRAASVHAFETWHTIAKGHLSLLRESAHLLDADQAGLLEVMVSEMKAYDYFSRQCVESRMAPTWNLARYWLVTRAVDTGREADGLLKVIASNQRREMYDAVAYSSRMDNVIIVLLVSMSVFGMAAAWIFSRRRAQTIAGSIRGLARATHEIALGHMDESIPLDGPFEIAQLANSFNIMRRKLKDREVSLKASETKVRMIVETAVDGIITIDDRGRIASFNRGAVRIFGYEPEEVIGENVSMLMPEPDRGQHDRYISNYKETGIPRIIGVGREVVGIRKDGTEFPLLLSVSQLAADTREGFVGMVHDIGDLKITQEALVESEAKYRALAMQLSEVSQTDALTGLYNRRALDDFLDTEWRRAQREERGVGFILLDIDSFKQFNDNYGHRAGDDCLKAVAESLESNLMRAADLVARYGGEEFAVMLPGASEGEVTAVAEKLRESVLALNIPHEFSKAGDTVSISLGGAIVVPADSIPLRTLIERADQALYQSKENGRNRFTFFTNGKAHK